MMKQHNLLTVNKLKGEKKNQNCNGAKSDLHYLPKHIVYFHQRKVSQNEFNIRAINFSNIDNF